MRRCILILLTLAAAGFASSAQAATPPCPAFAYQRANDGGFYLRVVSYRQAGHALRVRFHDTPTLHRTYHLTRRHTTIRAWRQTATTRRLAHITCTPNLPRAQRRRVPPGYYPPGARLPVATVWTWPTSQTAPAPLPPPPTPGPTPPSPTPPIPPIPPGKAAYTVMAAGDIAQCDLGIPSAGAAATATLLGQAAPDAILALGDTAYDSGTPNQYTKCYDPTWGPYKPLTHPIIGNHEVACGTTVFTGGCVTPGQGYWDYFGAAAGPRNLGYYSFDIGSWHVIALNSELEKTAAAAQASTQRAWLLADLVAHPNQCTLAMWHRPAFSGISPVVDPEHGDNAAMQVYFQDLYNAHADVVLNGHVHAYERWAQLDPSGNPDPHGVREFISGLGGATIYGVDPKKPGQQVVWHSNYGLLKLTLTATSYSWEWVNVPPNTDPGRALQLQDSGSTPCA